MKAVQQTGDSRLGLWVAHVERMLAEQGSEERRQVAVTYFPTAMRVLGVPVPALRAVAKAPQERMATAGEFLAAIGAVQAELTAPASVGAKITAPAPQSGQVTGKLQGKLQRSGRAGTGSACSAL